MAESSSRSKTIEEMEKDLVSEMIEDGSDDARLILDTSSHALLNLSSSADGHEKNEPNMSNNSAMVPSVAPEQPNASVEELYKKDNPILGGGSASNSKLTEESLVEGDGGNSSKDGIASTDDSVKRNSHIKSALKTSKPDDGKSSEVDSNRKTRVSFTNSQEIYNLPNAQLFAISPSDNTAKALEAGELRIVEIPGRIPENATRDSFSQSSPPPAFLQVGNWVYPLIPYNSPIYRSEEGHYVFPDLKADKAGAAMGLVLPTNTLQMELDEFEGILKTFTKLDEFTFAPPMMFGNTSVLIDLARKTEDALVDQVVSDIIHNEASKSKAAIISRLELLKSRESIKGKDVVVPVPIKDEEKKKDNNNIISSTEKPPQQGPGSPDIMNCGRDNQRFGGFGFVGHHRNEQQRENHSAKYLSTRIADGIVAGAEVITRGVTYGASKTSEILNQGTGLLKSYSEGPTNSPAEIPRRLHGGVKTVKKYTGKFVELSSYVVDELGNATSALAEYLSPYLHQTTTTLVEKATGSSTDDSNYILGNVLEITSGTLQGMNMVYSGLHEAARILAKSITNNTVDVVTHYYGPKAGEIIDDAAETVGNIALGGSNTQSLSPKAVVARAAKDTGVVLLTKEEPNNS